MGCAFVTVLLLIVLGPLLLVSNASPISTPLPVTSASLSIGLAISSGGTFPLGHISRVEIANLPPASPLRTAPFYAAACAAATDAAQAEHTCGYSYLLGDWRAEITPRSRRDRVEVTPKSRRDHERSARYVCRSVDYQRLNFANASDFTWSPSAQVIAHHSFHRLITRPPFHRVMDAACCATSCPVVRVMCH